MTTFNAHNFPLQGRRLIEASAGTGKTYSIASLFVRLILGDQRPTPLTVEQILVVTFTKAATNELRGRIRDKIRLTLEGFRTGNSNDVFIRELLGRNTLEPAIACQLLNSALVCMDEASVFTIHGFAVRAIQTFLFETGALADVDVSETSSDGTYNILLDLYRSITATSDATVMFSETPFTAWEAFHKFFNKPLPLHAVIQPLPVHTSNNVLADIHALFTTLMAERAALRTVWQRHFKDVEPKEIQTLFNKELSNLKLSGVYLVRYLLKYITGSAIEYDRPKKDYFYDYIAWQPVGNLQPLAQLLFDFSAHLQACKQFYPTVKALLAAHIRERKQLAAGAAMGPDDVIALINRVLSDDARAPALRTVVTSTYPVCLVDEFQDTDPAQFDMFNQLYRDSDAAGGLVMIGDPKQSIYGFRGADIFSYLNVRDGVVAQEMQTHTPSIFTLDINYRSKQLLVTAVNALFQEAPDGAPPSFIYSGMPYQAVASCETLPESHKKHIGDYSSGDATTSASLVWIGNPDTDCENVAALAYAALRRAYARDTAQRIAALLDNAAAHIKGQRICAGDITVLVKNGTEARVIKQELSILRIGSVYISQRDNVLNSADFSSDIYHILRAINNPHDKRLLRSALATPLLCKLSGDFSALDALGSDDAVYEQLIDEFGSYAATWDAHGILAALDQLTATRGLIDAFVRQPDCDRLMTDFRHLGDLLQQQSVISGSREQVIDWYAKQINEGSSDLEEDTTRLRLESDDNLVKVVTIHASKGLEYPVVFLPFFFMPRIPPDNGMPLVHDKQPPFTTIVDFGSDDPDNDIKRESLAEDIRLLYVALTRAVYQCYVGISAASYKQDPVFSKTLWPSLLGIDEKAQPFPTWDTLQAALQQTFASCTDAVSYVALGSSTVPVSVSRINQQLRPLVDHITCPVVPLSSWVITSYSRLAHAKQEVITRGGASDEHAAVDVDAHELEESDGIWRDNIRYTLKGSANTGDCLHSIYEQLALAPSRYLGNTADCGVATLVQNSLRQYGLEQPEHRVFAYWGDADKQREIAQRCTEVEDWLHTTLDTPLINHDVNSSLRQLFMAGSVLPEMGFDFSLGTVQQPVQIVQGLNSVLAQCGVGGVHVPQHSELSGLMTGSIDLLFVHNKKIYVLDYKSNTLGKAPRFYDHTNMTHAMQENRYDLQYLIYSVAAHRYMQQRLGSRYAFDTGEYSFGGVLYLFLRGMGLSDFPQHGIWFKRPDAEQILALDTVLKGGAHG